MSTTIGTTQTDNKETVQRLLAAFGVCDDDAMDALLAPGFVAHGMPPGFPGDAAGLKQQAAAMHAGLRDCRFELGDVIAEGDRVVVRYTTHARHAGELFGIAPSGREVTITGMEMYRLADGVIAEYWGLCELSEPG